MFWCENVRNILKCFTLLNSGKLAGKYQPWEMGCFTFFHLTFRVSAHSAPLLQPTPWKASAVDTTRCFSSLFQTTNIVITRLEIPWASTSFGPSSQALAARAADPAGSNLRPRSWLGATPQAALSIAKSPLLTSVNHLLFFFFSFLFSFLSFLFFSFLFSSLLCLLW